MDSSGFYCISCVLLTFRCVSLDVYIDSRNHSRKGIKITSQFLSLLSNHIGRRILIGKTSNFQNRIYGVTLVIGLWWAAMFGFSMGDATLASHLQYGIGTFLIVSIIFNLICSIVFWFLVPQTKGKSYYEIFVDLNFEQT